MMKFPLPILSDSYKGTHWGQIQDGTTKIEIYFESRFGAKYGFTQVTGYQYAFKEYLEGVVVTLADVFESKGFYALHFGDPTVFNEDGWMHIINEHGGRLPLHIEAVPEGSVVPISNAIMTVVNTCDECRWLDGFLDSLLTHMWYPSNVATIGRSLKHTMMGFLERTGSDMNAINFMLHDFGFRGASSVESAAIGGGAHLTNFMGTDTMIAIPYLQHYYGAEGMPAFSVVATEHSVMTALGDNRDLEVLDQLIEKYPNGILSVVADSYDVYTFTEGVIERKEKILGRNGRFVLRPDSTTKVHATPAELVVELLDMLWDGFGGKTTHTGHVVLHDQIRLLWGDGLSPEDILDILAAMERSGYAAENIVFGMGGGLLQKHDRDTQRNTFKCWAQERNGVWVDVRKLAFGKSSKEGRHVLVIGEEGMVTRRIEDVRETDVSQFVTVFHNGEVTLDQKLDDIRVTADRTWKDFVQTRIPA